MHKDGEMRCLSSSLDAERWHTRIEKLTATELKDEPPPTNLQVDYVSLINAQTAGEGLLKERADLQAMLGGEGTSGATNSAAMLLFVITSSNIASSTNERRKSFHLFSIRPGQFHLNDGILLSSNPWLHHMQSTILPDLAIADSIRPSKPQMTLHSASGMLYLYAEKELRIYNLSEPVPKLSSHIRLDQCGAVSFLRLSSSSILAASPTSATIYDTWYRSAQASLDLGNNITLDKKFTTASDRRPSVRLLSYFSSLRLLIALNERNELFALRITLSGFGVSGNRKRKRHGLLINSIGKGINDPSTDPEISKSLPTSLGNYLPSSLATSDQSWRKQMAKLNDYILQNEVDLFEDLMAQELGIASRGMMAASQNQEGKPPMTAPDQGLGHGVQVPVHSTHILEKSSEISKTKLRQDQRPSGAGFRHIPVDRHKILYVLSRIFSWTSPKPSGNSSASDANAPSKLSVVFFPPIIVDWLIATGNISTSHVELALRYKENSIIPPILPPGALSESLLAFDPSLKTIMSILEGPAYLEAIELTRLLKLLLHIIEAEESTSRKLLTNGIEPLHDGRLEHTDRLIVALAADDDNSAVNEQSIYYRQVLVAALRKLHAYPASTISKALRKTFTAADTISFIHQLRIELAECGWTSRYVNGEVSSPSYHHIHGEVLGMIGDMLNCALDSTGMGGWVFGTLALDDPEEREDMIAYMKAEISAVLEGVEEATYLGGLLGEMLLYGKSVSAGPRKANMAVDHNKKRLAPITMPLISTDANFLPLSLKAPRNVSATKVGAGGEVQKRSKRDIGRLKSRMVGKYSRERIVV